MLFRSVRTAEGWEVDFLARSPKSQRALIQVCADLSDPTTREREARALEAASEQFPRASLCLLTLTPELSGGIGPKVEVRSAAEWFLEPWLGKISGA